MQPILSINERSIANNMIRKVHASIPFHVDPSHQLLISLLAHWILASQLRSLSCSCCESHLVTGRVNGSSPCRIRHRSVYDWSRCAKGPHSLRSIRRSLEIDRLESWWFISIFSLNSSAEDNLLPGFRFKIPMMIVLDTLKNDDPSLRRIGETWMRCSLKSYLRVLDPILFDLLDPSIRRSLTTAKIQGKELTGFLYERPFDQRYIYHLLETLLSIVRFGGQGFAKTARSTPIRRTHHSDLRQRVETGEYRPGLVLNMPFNNHSDRLSRIPCRGQLFRCACGYIITVSGFFSCACVAGLLTFGW